MIFALGFFGEWLVILLRGIVIIDGGFENKGFALQLHLLLLPVLVFGCYFLQEVKVSGEMAPVLRVQELIGKHSVFTIYPAKGEVIG